MGDMNGQVAVVTGGTRGIGLAISERLLNRGVTVAAGYATNHDHAGQFADKYADRGVSVHQGNVGHNEDVLRVFGEVLDRHGHVDIVVNNAGITIDKTVRKMDPQEWDHVIHVNLSGAFYTSRAVLQHMLDRGYGRIINISSIVGQTGFGMVLPYVASKFAVTGMSQSLAAELAPHNITVNSIHPGVLETDLHSAVVQAFNQLRNISIEDGWEWFRGRIPLGRFQTPRDIGEMAAFLASDRAQNITGASFNVDGGWEMH